MTSPARLDISTGGTEKAATPKSKTSRPAVTPTRDAKKHKGNGKSKTPKRVKTPLQIIIVDDTSDSDCSYGSRRVKRARANAQSAECNLSHAEPEKPEYNDTHVNKDMETATDRAADVLVPSSAPEERACEPALPPLLQLPALSKKSSHGQMKDDSGICMAGNESAVTVPEEVTAPASAAPDSESIEDFKQELQVLSAAPEVTSVYSKGVHKVSCTPALSTVSEESAQASTKSQKSFKLTRDTMEELGNQEEIPLTAGEILSAIYSDDSHSPSQKDVLQASRASPEITEQRTNEAEAIPKPRKMYRKQKTNRRRKAIENDSEREGKDGSEGQQDSQNICLSNQRQTRKYCTSARKQSDEEERILISGVELSCGAKAECSGVTGSSQDDQDVVCIQDSQVDSTVSGVKRQIQMPQSKNDGRDVTRNVTSPDFELDNENGNDISPIHEDTGIEPNQFYGKRNKNHSSAGARSRFRNDEMAKRTAASKGRRYGAKAKGESSRSKGRIGEKKAVPLSVFPVSLQKCQSRGKKATGERRGQGQGRKRETRQVELWKESGVICDESNDVSLSESQDPCLMRRGEPEVSAIEENAVGNPVELPQACRKQKAPKFFKTRAKNKRKHKDDNAFSQDLFGAGEITAVERVFGKSKTKDTRVDGEKYVDYDAFDDLIIEDDTPSKFSTRMRSNSKVYTPAPGLGGEGAGRRNDKRAVRTYPSGKRNRLPAKEQKHGGRKEKALESKLSVLKKNTVTDKGLEVSLADDFGFDDGDDPQGVLKGRDGIAVPAVAKGSDAPPVSGSAKGRDDTAVPGVAKDRDRTAVPSVAKGRDATPVPGVAKGRDGTPMPSVPVGEDGSTLPGVPKIVGGADAAVVPKDGQANDLGSNKKKHSVGKKYNGAGEAGVYADLGESDDFMSPDRATDERCATPNDEDEGNEGDISSNNGDGAPGNLSNVSRPCEETVPRSYEGDQAAERTRRHRKHISYKEPSESEFDDTLSIGKSCVTRGRGYVETKPQVTRGRGYVETNPQEEVKKKKHKRSVFSDTPDDATDARSEVSWLSSTARKKKPKAEKTYSHRQREPAERTANAHDDETHRQTWEPAGRTTNAHDDGTHRQTLEPAQSTSNAHDDETHRQTYSTTVSKKAPKPPKKRKRLETTPNEEELEEEEEESLYFQPDKKRHRQRAAREDQQSDTRAEIEKDLKAVFAEALFSERVVISPLHVTPPPQCQAGKKTQKHAKNKHHVMPSAKPISTHFEPVQGFIEDEIENFRFEQQHVNETIDLSPILPIPPEHLCRIDSPPAEEVVAEEKAVAGREVAAEEVTGEMADCVDDNGPTSQRSGYSHLSSLKTPETPFTQGEKDSGNENCEEQRCEGVTVSLDAAITGAKSGPSKRAVITKPKEPSESESETSSGEVGSDCQHCSQSSTRSLKPRRLFEDEKGTEDENGEEEPGSQECGALPPPLACDDLGDADGSIMSMLTNFCRLKQRSITSKQNLLQKITEETIRITQREIGDCWESQREKRDRILTAYRATLTTELLNVEKEVKRIRTAEEHMMAYFKKQLETLHRSTSEAERGLHRIQKIHRDFDTELKGAEKSQGMIKGQMKGAVQQEMRKLQEKILNQTQQQELQNVKRSLQAMFL